MPGYLGSLAEHLAGEQADTLKELESLAGNIDHIKEIVAMQQSYARVVGRAGVAAGALIWSKMPCGSMPGAMERHQVQVIREYRTAAADPGGQAQGAADPGEPHPQRQVRLDDRGHTDKRMVLQVGLNGNDVVKISVM